MLTSFPDPTILQTRFPAEIVKPMGSKWNVPSEAGLTVRTPETSRSDVFVKQ